MEEVREGAVWMPRRVLRAEGTASAKAIRQVFAWWFPVDARKAASMAGAE